MAKKTIEKLEGKSLDLEQENIDKIKELFPQVVTEGKIDFDMLKEVLGEEVDRSHEKYQFTWNGKSKTIKLAQSPSTGTLRPSKEDSKNWDTTENLYIEGDNLEVLKQLQKTYFNKVKMIYIDPPYNTGGDFVYKDDFKDNIQNYKEQTNQTRKSNADTSGRYHTDWLNMMYSRLMLAKNILLDDGIIFVSINDYELYNLKKICDEIFGESNFVNNIIWRSNPGGNKQDFVESTKQYILVYAKHIDKISDLGVLKKHDNESYLHKDQYGKYKKGNQLEKWGNDDTIYTHPRLGYSIYYNPEKEDYIIKYDYNINELIKNRSIEMEYNKPDNDLLTEGYYCIRPRRTNANQPGRWRVEENTFNKRYAHNDFIFAKRNDTYKIYEKNRFNKNKFIKMKDFISDDVAKQTNDTVELLDGKLFSYPKPVNLVKYLLKNIRTDDFTIMDFFSGSATTAHAVMKQNAEDGGNRKFIMVQLPEKTDENSEAYKAGYENLCEIGKERIRRAGEQIKEDMESKGMDASKLDTGFKVFKLDDTNIKEWDSSVEVTKQSLLDHLDVIKEDRNEEDVLYETLLKYGVFDKPVKEISLNHKTVYDVGEGYMIVTLNDEIGFEDVKAIGEKKPHVVIFKETGFKDDNAKINALHTLDKMGVEDVKSI